MFPTPQKTYLCILEKLLEINEIHYEGRESRLLILCHKVMYLSRTKNQFRAERLIDDIEVELDPKSDSYLFLLAKVCRGLVLLNLGKPEEAKVFFVSVISSVHETSKKQKVERKNLVLYYSSHYWTAYSCHFLKQYTEAAKYCDAIVSFLNDDPIIETDSEMKAILNSAYVMLGDIDERCNKKFRVEHYMRKDAVDILTGVTLRNVEGYQFYNSSVPVKKLDEFWPENDKESRMIRALGKSINANKLSPYQSAKPKGQLITIDFREHPVGPPVKPKKLVIHSSGKLNDLACSKPLEVASHENDHKVALGLLLTDLKQINNELSM